MMDGEDCGMKKGIYLSTVSLSPQNDSVNCDWLMASLLFSLHFTFTYLLVTYIQHPTVHWLFFHLEASAHLVGSQVYFMIT